MDNNQNNQNANPYGQGQNQADPSQYQYGQTGYYNNQNSEQTNQAGNQQQGYQQSGYQQPGYQYQNYQQPGYQQQYQQASYNPNNRGPIGEIRSPITVLILSIVTCGIYGIIWFFTVSQEINTYTRNEYIPQGLVIGSIFCFPLYLIVENKIDQALYDIDLAEGRRAENRFTIWLILSFLGGIGTFMMMYQVQESLNNIWASNNPQNYNQPHF